MKQLIVRAAEWLVRLLRCSDSLTWMSAVRLLTTRKDDDRLRCAVIRNSPSKFYYRGRADYGAMSHFYEKGFAISETQAVRWILDIGANIGDETLKFALRHPNARVIALEPEDGNFEVLERNFASLRPRISLLKAGAWNRDCRLALVDNGGNEGFSVIESEAGEIVGRSIDSILTEFGLEGRGIVKLDCEGAERMLFDESGGQWLKQTDVLIIEVADHESPGTVMLMFRAMERHGLIFDFSIVGENLVAVRRGSGKAVGTRFGLSGA